MADSNEAALAYHEPSITVILILASFLLLLNVLNWALDAILYCGLIGQILVGVIWGTPGAGLLSRGVEDAVVQLGYLGLVLIVFEGGLSTSFPSLKANLALSVAVAATGIGVPIALSFVLTSLTGASSLQCFAAGAALCSTSLGTTFAVLRASGLAPTRLGVVLTSAAMLDDVVGLVMVQVISSLGSTTSSISAMTVVRPVLVSLAFAVVPAVFCRLAAKPLIAWTNSWRITHPKLKVNRIFQLPTTAFIFHTALLIGLVAGSSFAGTSNLFAAYIAGAAISWWDSELPRLSSADREVQRAATTIPEEALGERVMEPPNNTDTGAENPQAPQASRADLPTVSHEANSGHTSFAHYYYPAMRSILQPFFFASIGFSIPIKKMFRGPVIWKGLVFAVLMMVGKLSCGVWLIRMPDVAIRVSSWIRSQKKRLSATTGSPNNPGSGTLGQNTTEKTVSSKPDESCGEAPMTRAGSNSADDPTPDIANVRPSPPKPLSLYPAVILGLAMTARGEIGFLISSVAQGNGLLGGGEDSMDSEIFLVVTWAIVLCTIVGPLCVGLLVRRVGKPEKSAIASANSQGDGGTRNVLGVWGVQCGSSDRL